MPSPHWASRHRPSVSCRRLRVERPADCAATGLTIVDESGPKMADTVYWPMQHGRQVGALARELDYFAACVRSGTPPKVIRPREAARALAAMEAAEESSRLGRPVPFSF